MRVLQRRASRSTMVVEDEHVLQRRVVRMMAVAVHVGLHDLLDLVTWQQRGRRSMVRARDQDLARPDGVTLPEGTVMPLLPIRVQPKGRIEIGNHPNPPAFRV